ncbi:MAG: LysE family translocator [Alphaproteobacteria bacterium]|nr:LysE family translocator [Alphaproteobacteria bacterium]MYH58922.1 LysE family translocator [Boseongicola sp. SB0675_bin_26]
MSVETYLLYLAALGVFFATPPDTSQLLVLANSARHGLRKSGWTIAGDLTANVLQMTAAAFGIAGVIAASAEAFQVVKWLGVAYLAWIGLRLLLSRSRGAATPDPKAGSSIALFRQAFITSSANPFAVMFFAALFPQFINPGASTLPQLAVLGGTYLLVDGVILLAWGWLGARAAAWIRTRDFGLVNRICGALMLGAATLLAAKDFDPQESR